MLNYEDEQEVAENICRDKDKIRQRELLGLLVEELDNLGCWSENNIRPKYNNDNNHRNFRHNCNLLLRGFRCPIFESLSTGTKTYYFKI